MDCKIGDHFLVTRAIVASALAMYILCRKRGGNSKAASPVLVAVAVALFLDVGYHWWVVPPEEPIVPRVVAATVKEEPRLPPARCRHGDSRAFYEECVTDVGTAPSRFAPTRGHAHWM